MSDIVTTKQLAAALDALILEEEKLDLEEDDITINRLCVKTGWNPYRAKKVIGEWVALGKVVFVGERRNPQRGALVQAWKLKL